eukprot:121-Pelagococcus_subviridis.AAC.1
MNGLPVRWFTPRFFTMIASLVSRRRVPPRGEDCAEKQRQYEYDIRGGSNTFVRVITLKAVPRVHSRCRPRTLDVTRFLSAREERRARGATSHRPSIGWRARGGRGGARDGHGARARGERRDGVDAMRRVESRAEARRRARGVVARVARPRAVAVAAAADDVDGSRRDKHDASRGG